MGPEEVNRQTLRQVMNVMRGWKKLDKRRSDELNGKKTSSSTTSSVPSSELNKIKRDFADTGIPVDTGPSIKTRNKVRD